VVEQLAQGRAPAAPRVVVEKPFGHDLESARALNAILLSVFDGGAHLRIDNTSASAVHKRCSSASSTRSWSRFLNRSS